MTWRQLIRLELGLKDLERQALDAHRAAGPTDWEQREAIKKKLGKVVGWWCGSRDSRLVEGWDVCYGHLLTCWETGRRPNAKPKGPEGGLPPLEELERLSQPDLGVTP